MGHVQKAEHFFNSLPLRQRNHVMAIITDVWKEDALHFYLARGKDSQEIVDGELADFPVEIRNVALKSISLKLAEHAGDELLIKVVGEAVKFEGFQVAVAAFVSIPRQGGRGESAHRAQTSGKPAAVVDGVGEYSHLPVQLRNRIARKVKSSWAGHSLIFHQTRLQHTEEIINNQFPNSPTEIKRGILKMMMQKMSEDEDYLGYFIKVGK